MKVRRVDFSPDEWIAGTVGMTNAERGLYIMACALIYSHGGPIPEPELRRACGRDHGHAYKRQLDCLISAGKLTVNDGQIANKRCLNELQKAEERSVNGQKKAAKRWNNKAVGDSPALQPANAIHQPSTINHTKEASASLDGSAPAARANTKEGRSYGPASRKTRIPTDWEPDLQDCQYAAGLGWDASRIGEQADAFADYYRREGKLVADWHAAWRTWCRKADEYAAQRYRPNGQAPNGHAAARSGSFATAARNVAARLDLGGE